ncbi:MAG: cell division protein FtsA [Candidatus Pacebacteria bacterium]|nr:cell division protein FtsA [Candidatus Paceibacterota bacterium]
MSRKPIIAAIDLGTDKCVTLVATFNEETGKPQIVGVSAVKSRGMKKSAIVNLEEVSATLTESLDGAERMAGLSISEAYISVSGSNIKSQNSKGVVAVANPNQEINHEDVERVIEAARAVSLPNDRQIIHVVPRDFKVDSQTGIKDPVGMTGIRLESEAHIITGLSTSLKNIKKSVTDLGVELNSFVFSGLASAISSATETEKELGVAVVDIGSECTSLCVYVEGSLEYSATIPVGAKHITKDIAVGCRISLDSAEAVKLMLSSNSNEILTPKPGESKEELNKRRKQADLIDLDKLELDEEGTKELSKKSVIEGIMVPRMKEIFTLIGKDLEKNNLLPLIPAGLVITGGGAETVSIIEVAKKTMRLPARVGRPKEMEGITRDINRPTFATSIGLIEYAISQGAISHSKSSFDLGSMFKGIKIGGIGEKAKGLFKSLIP